MHYINSNYKNCFFFQKSVTIYHFKTLFYEKLLSISPHKLVRPPCWYYQLQKIAKHYFRVDPAQSQNVYIKFNRNQAVLQFNHGGRWMDGQTDMLYMRSCTSCEKNNS